jgi:HSP20 family molecular chaperone IbpA
MTWADFLDQREVRQQRTEKFDQRLSWLDKHAPQWNQPLVDVVDTIEHVKIGLESIGINDNFLLIEAVRMVLERHDRSAAAKGSDGEP